MAVSTGRRRSPDSVHAHETLQIDQDERFQRRKWRIQRLSWIAMLLLLAAALAGVFGDGPLSRVSAGDTATLHAEYQRFVRHHAPALLRLRIGGRALGADGELRLAVSRQYLQAFEIGRITPEPQRVAGSADELVFVFALAPGVRALEVTFELQPAQLGSHSGSVRAGDRASLHLKSFTYP